VKEEWRAMERGYSVSNIGRVRRDAVGSGASALHILDLDTSGRYDRCWVSVRGKKKHINVAREVACAFIGEPKSKQQINHIDGNARNNQVDNLEWCSASHNIQHAFYNGLVSVQAGDEHWSRRNPRLVRRGADNGASMLSESQVR